MQVVPSWDLFLIIFFIVSVGYSLVLQRDRVVVTLLAVYVGIVAAQVLGLPLHQFFAGDRTIGDQLFIRAETNPFVIQTIIFFLTVVLVTVRAGLTSRSQGGSLSTFELILFSFFNSALILTAVFSFMTPESQEAFKETSRIARVFIDRDMWWFLAPIIALIALGGHSRGRGSNSNH